MIVSRFWFYLNVAVMAFSFQVLHGADKKILYENNLEQTAVGEMPEAMLVLNGNFSVKQEGTNKFLELPGAPLETYGVLFGPAVGSDAAIRARIFGTSQGRRFPTFAVALNNLNGYRLQVAPAKKALELLKGEELVKSVPFDWKSGTWTLLHLQTRKIKEKEWIIEGKAWSAESKEPGQWLISTEEKEGLNDGKPSVWGKPYSGTPIYFDDLQLLIVSPLTADGRK